MKKVSLMELSHVSKIYGMGDVSLRALNDVSLKIHKGEFVVICGPSGSGKSTLLHMIGLLDNPTTGSVFVAGRDTKDMSPDQTARLRGEKIGFVFQFFNLDSSLSALENVMLPGWIIEKENKEYAEWLLKLVGLEDRKNHLPSQLSGGQRQRVAIARALMNRPDIILADEPTGNLDSSSGEQVMTMLKDLNQKTGTTLVLITHDKGISKYADHLVEIKDGRVVSDSRDE